MHAEDGDSTFLRFAAIHKTASNTIRIKYDLAVPNQHYWACSLQQYALPQVVRNLKKFPKLRQNYT